MDNFVFLWWSSLYFCIYCFLFVSSFFSSLHIWMSLYCFSVHFLFFFLTFIIFCFGGPTYRCFFFFFLLILFFFVLYFLFYCLLSVGCGWNGAFAWIVPFRVNRTKGRKVKMWVSIFYFFFFFFFTSRNDINTKGSVWMLISWKMGFYLMKYEVVRFVRSGTIHATSS
jgi:hypothetical protein